MSTGVYILTNKANGKVYVGSSTRLSDRKSSHFSKLRQGSHANKHLQAAFDIYGADEISFEILEKLPETRLLEREAYWIQAFAATDKTCGYNTAADPRVYNRGSKWSSATAARHASASRKTYEFISPTGELTQVTDLKKFCKEHNFHYTSAVAVSKGRRLSFGEGYRRNSLENLGQCWTGRKYSDNVNLRKTGRLSSPNGEIHVFHGIAAFCRTHNLNIALIAAVLAGARHHHKGWRKI